MASHRHIDRALLAAFAAVFLLSLFSLRFAARNTVMDGIFLGGVDLGGMSYAQASVVLADIELGLLNQPVQIEYKGVIEEATLADLGFSLNKEATVEQLQGVSYGDGVIDHFGARIVTLFSEIGAEPVVDFDSHRMAETLRGLYSNLQPPRDAELVVDGNGVSVVGHFNGARIDSQAVFEQVLPSLVALELPERIAVDAVSVQPAYLTSEAEADAEVLRGVLGRKITLSFAEFVNMERERTFTVTGDWLRVKEGETLFNEDFVGSILRSDMAPEIDREVQHAKIVTLPDGQGHAEVEGTARNGLSLNIEQTIELLKGAIENNAEYLEVAVDVEPGLIVNEVTDDEFVLVSQGVSGYWGSPWGRRYNIDKGLSEVLNNVVVPAGEEFSFNKTIGPIEKSYGWQDSLAIFGAEELIPVPGGGLCQVSTTLYRAALAADLEILEQSGHTLYITYYEEFGNGLDAAIYPGYKDFRFVNTMEGALLMQGYTEGDFGYLNIYGPAPEKEVELIGPIYSGRIPERYKDLIEFVDWNEIAWIQEVTHDNGTVEQNVILSRYKTAPRKLY